MEVINESQSVEPNNEQKKNLPLSLVPVLSSLTTNTQSMIYRQSVDCNASFEDYLAGKTKGWHCKSRWCPICNAIRTAQVIERLTPVFEQWHEAWFVTLTQGPNVSGEALKVTIADMQKNFVRCKDRAKKRSQRAGVAKFVGIRKLEVTYNGRDNSYSPVFKVLVCDKEIAYNIVSDWVKLNPQSTANIQQCTDPLKEMTSVTLHAITDENSDDPLSYIDAKHTMIASMDKIRTMQTFGFTLPDDEKVI